jgi:S1-C subfamily serine protease
VPPAPAPAPPRAPATSSRPAIEVPAGSGAFGEIPRIYQDVQPSIVAIFAGPQEGSGVIWDGNGVVITNNHVVEGFDDVEVGFATGERVAGRVRATDPRTDLAVVEVGRTGLPAARFADGLPLVGELAIAIGNPLGLENSVTAGIISGLNRSIPGAVTAGEVALVDLIQTDAAISPGNSGGALVNGQGQVVGINVAYIPPSAGSVSIGFAVPAPTVIDVVTQLLETGAVQHPFLGIQLAELTPQIADQFGIDAEQGVLVLGVEGGTPAADAGLQEGDVIVGIDGDQVASAGDLLGLLRRHRPGELVTLRVVRNGDELELPVTLGERPT